VPVDSYDREAMAAFAELRADFVRLIGGMLLPPAAGVGGASSGASSSGASAMLRFLPAGAVLEMDLERYGQRSHSGDWDDDNDNGEAGTDRAPMLQGLRLQAFPRLAQLSIQLRGVGVGAAIQPLCALREFLLGGAAGQRAIGVRIKVEGSYRGEPLEEGDEGEEEPLEEDLLPLSKAELADWDAAAALALQGTAAGMRALHVALDGFADVCDELRQARGVDLADSEALAPLTLPRLLEQCRRQGVALWVGVGRFPPAEEQE
jgi:hypothetical protein